MAALIQPMDPSGPADFTLYDSLPYSLPCGISCAYVPQQRWQWHDCPPPWFEPLWDYQWVQLSFQLAY